EEREAAVRVIARLNQSPQIAEHYTLTALNYKELVPPVVAGQNAQLVVDKYMKEAGQSDLFVCILSQRMGTPVLDEATGQHYESGNEYEFINAYTTAKKTQKPIVLLYRGIKPKTELTDPEQYGKVDAFFKQFEGSSPRYKGLYKSFATTEEFETVLYDDLNR